MEGTTCSGPRPEVAAISEGCGLCSKGHEGRRNCTSSTTNRSSCSLFLFDAAGGAQHAGLAGDSRTEGLDRAREFC